MRRRGTWATIGIVSATALPTKTCAVCGRTMTWRTSWARTWDEVRYCSQACRRRRASPLDDRLEQAIRDLLQQRPRSSSICPSEAARAVSPENWRSLVQPARDAARRLVSSGEVEIVQGGRVVDPSTARGPVRVRRRR